MPAHSKAGADALVRKLDSIFSLNEEERAATRELPVHVVEFRPDQDLVREGDRPSRCCLVLDGFACIYKTTGDGRRQISAFQVPGDVPDLLSLHLRTMDSTIGTLSPCRVGFIRHDSVRDLCRRFPRITDALWRATLIDAAIFREWLTNVGQRQARARLAHLICETYVRLDAVNLAADRVFDFPITQNRLAEATGMSTVHVNRTLQDLRGSELIELRNNRLKILDWDGLQEAGDFEAEYLHIGHHTAGLAA